MRKLIGTQARRSLFRFSLENGNVPEFIVVVVGVMKARPDDSSEQGRDY